MGKGGFGFLTIAIGHSRYIEQARVLSLSLRRNMPGARLAIVTDSEALDSYAEFIIRPLPGLAIGVVQKIYLDKYTPFEETLFIDSDCIVTRPFFDELDKIKQFDFSPATDRMARSDCPDEFISDLPKALEMVGGKTLPKFNGGVYFFRQGSFSASVFSLAREIHPDYRKYGIKVFDRSGPGEESLFQLATARLSGDKLYFDQGRLMMTPTDSVGRIWIEPLGQGCSFLRGGKLESPAICHFAGHYIFRPEYRLAAYSLENNIPVERVGAWLAASIRLKCLMARFKKFLEYKIHGLRKRLLLQTDIDPVR